MTDPKLLQEIAQKAAAFANDCIASDYAIEADTVLRNVAKQNEDKRTIESLRPKYVASVAFFIGYKRATERWGTVDGKPFVEHVRDLVHAKPDEGIIDAIVRLLKEHEEFLKDREVLREEYTSSCRNVEGLTKWLEIEVAAKGSMRSQTIDELRSLQNRIASIRALGNSAQVRDAATQYVEETIAKLATLSEPKTKNIGIVKKPPPPVAPLAPMPESEVSDELAQAAASFTNAETFTRCGDDDADRVRAAWSRIESPHAFGDWGHTARGFVAGAHWQLSARLREYEVRLSGTETERLVMKEERDLALAKVRAWEERTGETQPRIVQARLESNITIPEIVAWIRTGFADSEVGSPNAFFRDALLNLLENRVQGSTNIGKKESDDDVQVGESGVSDPQAVQGAIDADLIHAFDVVWHQGERVEYRSVDGIRLAELPIVLRRHYKPIDGPKVDIFAVPEPQTTLVFRDDNERDFWDEQVHVLNRRGDRTPRDVASAVDEMVEERRKRLHSSPDPIEFVKSVWRQVLDLGYGCTWSKVDDRFNIRVWSGTTTLASLDVSESIEKRETVADVIYALIKLIPKSIEAREVTDDLLLEAAEYVNSLLPSIGPFRSLDLAQAKHAMQVDGGPAYAGCRHYVNGALRKARKS